MLKTISLRNPVPIAAALLCIGFTLGATPAEAAECDALPYPSKTWDKKLLKVACGVKRSGFSNVAKYYIDRFGMREEEWNRSGYGYGDDCDEKKAWETTPIGRTIAAWALLNFSRDDVPTDWNDTSGNWMQSSYNYAAGGYDKLKDLRSGACGDGKAARFSDGVFNDYIILYQQTFESDVLFRAGTLVHENWHHRKDISHTCGEGADDYFYYDHYTYQPNNCARCPPTRVLNPDPSFFSTYGAEIFWYYSYKKHAKTNTSDAMKERAIEHLRSRVAHNLCSTDGLPSAIKKLAKP